MKKTKGSKLLAALLVLSLCMGVLGACGKDGQEGNSQPGPEAALPQDRQRANMWKKRWNCRQSWQAVLWCRCTRWKMPCTCW